MVLNNDLHHPSLLARDAGTLDVLSDGRVELGLGAGHAEPEYRRAGIAFDRPGVRVDRLAEAVPVLRQLLDGHEVTFTGTHYELTAERCAPRPARAVEAAGRTAPLEVNALVQAVVVTDSPRAAAERVARDHLPALSPDEVLATPYLMVGTVRELVDRLHQQRERWGINHYTVRPDALTHLEPVVAELAGR